MKKIRLLFTGLAIAAAASVSAQSVFSEDFNGVTPLSNWTLFNQDGLTPHTNVGLINDAWVVLAVSGDNAALSTSWYVPAGTADDYMITPAITLTTNNYLFFEGLALNAQFSDGYEVRLSTVGATVAGVLANPALLTVAAENSGTYNPRRIDLSSYSGQTVHLAWRNNSNDKLALAIDNVLVREVISNDAGIAEVNFANSYVTGTTVTVAGTIENAGSTALTSVDVNWSDNGGTTVNTNNLTVNIPAFSTAAFTHTVTTTASNPGAFTNLDVWTSNPNGVPDTLSANDTLSARFFTNNGTTVSKNPLLEEFTTAPCQFCPDGAVVVEAILLATPSVIAVGEHACFSTDAMTIPEASAYCAAFGAGAPTACIDRVLYPGETNVAISRAGGAWGNRAASQALLGSSVDVTLSGTFNSTTRQVNVDLSANFVDYAVPGDIRVTLFVVEDHVRGVGTGYNQVNAYNTVAGHPYFNAGAPIVNYDHRHVLRDVYPSTDAWGDATVIPTAPALNTPYVKNHTFTLNSSWDMDSISLVALVSYYDADAAQREVLNAYEVKLNNLVTSIDEIKKDEESLTIYPNPTANVSTIEFNLSTVKNVRLTLRDITGKEVLTEDFGKLSAGSQKVVLNAATLTNGIYFASIKIGEELVTKKISVNR
ncbi:MAG: choice-of-anchor J domain-containing protein [Flavobacteriales bacterium]|nr:choice-of-anchor J domain-containing protein [Flavobacteriales bacterium]